MQEGGGEGEKEKKVAEGETGGDPSMGKLNWNALLPLDAGIVAAERDELFERVCLNLVWSPLTQWMLQIYAGAEWCVVTGDTHRVSGELMTMLIWCVCIRWPSCRLRASQWVGRH